LEHLFFVDASNYFRLLPVISKVQPQVGWLRFLLHPLPLLWPAIVFLVFRPQQSSKRNFAVLHKDFDKTQDASLDWPLSPSSACELRFMKSQAAAFKTGKIVKSHRSSSMVVTEPEQLPP
jgi:hypothetical protein